MERELHAIVNPTSGNGRARRIWPRISQQLADRHFQVQAHLTTGPHDASRIAEQLARSGVPEILVVGGDGTINEVANGIVPECANGSSQPVVTVAPCGTGRDFSRSLGIRNLDHALSLLETGAICQVDVGDIRYQRDGAPQQRYFVNVADVGLGAETAAYINRSSKALGGFLTYLMGATRTILVFQGRSARVVVDDVTVYQGTVGMVVLANGRIHAGGMLLAPMASMRDGQLEVLVLHDVPKHQLLSSLLPRVYRGKHVGHPAVTHVRGRTVEVVAEQELLFEMDGEQPGTTDIRASVRPGALRVRVPQCDI